MKFNLAEETLGYSTSKDESNSDFRLLVGGSKNVLIDYQKKVKSRSGYTRLGAANTALAGNRNAWTWATSTGHKRPMRFNDDELEVYLEDIDGYTIDAWTRVANGWSTTELLRSIIQKGGNGGWYDSTEKIDLCLMVIADANIYEWTGGVAVVDSVTANTITKKGTSTFAANRFYTSRDKVLINVRTGTEFTYTAGEGTTTLTGVTGDPTADAMVDGDILIQKIKTRTNLPAASRTNHFIYNFENQIIIGSEDDNLILACQNTDLTDWIPSTPRVAGEGFTLTLDNPCRGITSLGSTLLLGAGKSVIFKVVFEQIAVGTTLAESAKIKRLDVGVNQGFLNQESIVPVGNTIFYLTNEVALRMIENPDNLVGINPKTLSNPIKPDFDAEDWDKAFGMWYKNTLYYSTPDASHLYMLNFVEDADGKLFRFWNPPQVLPVGAMTLIEIDGVEQLYGHSNGVPETYLLFDGSSDGVYDGMDVADKLPIECRAIFAYNNYKQKGVLKRFDEYYVEGEITPATKELELRLRYDFDGVTQSLTKIIDGSNEDVLEGKIGFNSLAQQSLAVNPLGGLLNPPTDARKFRCVFEIAPEDFFELQTEFYTNDIDKYWAILTHGSNAKLSRIKPINIKL
jgi:hypothetical protein